MKIKKLECLSVDYLGGEVICIIKDGIESWYWTPEGYGITYFLEGYEYTGLEKIKMNLDSTLEHLTSSIKKIIEDKVTDQNDPDLDMFERLHEMCK